MKKDKGIFTKGSLTKTTKTLHSTYDDAFVPGWGAYPGMGQHSQRVIDRYEESPRRVPRGGKGLTRRK